MPGAVLYRIMGAKFGNGMLRYRTEIKDAGMPNPAALDTLPMPSYALARWGVHHNPQLYIITDKQGYLSAFIPLSLVL
jgi:hypothetical protein